MHISRWLEATFTYLKLDEGMKNDNARPSTKNAGYQHPGDQQFISFPPTVIRVGIFYLWYVMLTYHFLFTYTI